MNILNATGLIVLTALAFAAQTADAQQNVKVGTLRCEVGALGSA